MDKNIAKGVRRISNLNSFTVLMFYVLTTALVAALNIALNAALSSGMILPEGLDMLLAMVLQYLVAVPVTLFVVYLIRNRGENKLSFTGCFCKPQMPASWIVKWIVITLGMVYIASIVSAAFFSFIEELTGTELNAIDINFGNSVFGIITTFVALPIFAPVFEELMFRGTIHRNCEPVGKWFAVIASAIVFGLFHVNYPQLLYAAVLGIFSSFMVAKTRSIFPSMLVHFIINTIGAVQLFLANGLDIEKMTVENLEYLSEHIVSYLCIGLIGMIIMCTILLSVVLLIIEIVKHRDSFKMDRGVFGISTARKTAIYYTAPVTVITYVLLIALTVVNAIQ